jgi:cytochrome c
MSIAPGFKTSGDRPGLSKVFPILFFLFAFLMMPTSQAQLKKHPAFSFRNISVSGITQGVTGLGVFPDGRLAVVTFRGTMDKPAYSDNPTFARPSYGGVYIIENGKATQIYDKILDAMGVLVHEGALYVTDQNQVIKFTEKNGVWSHATFLNIPTGDGYFEYSFGPVAPGDGYFYFGNSNHTSPPVGYMIKQKFPDRGTITRVPVQGGDYEVYAKGIRMPNGIGLGPDNSIVITENQGVWRPASVVNYIQKGKHYGYAHSVAERDSIADITPSAIQLPYKTITTSPAQPIKLDTGPFKDQLIFGDWPATGLYRAQLDPTVDDKGLPAFQGSCFYLTSGNIQSALRMVKDPGKNEIYLANISNYAYGSFQKLTYNPDASFFEVLAMRARSGGLEIEFTQPVGSGAETADNYNLEHWVYDYSVYKKDTKLYYYPDIIPSALSVSKVQVSNDKTRVFLTVNGMAEKSVIHVNLGNLTSQSGNSLVYKDGWYTLNYFSKVAFSPTPSPIPSVEKRKRISSDLQVQRQSGIIAFEWKSEYSSLTVQDLNGSVKKMFNVSGRKSFQWKGASDYKGLYLVKLQGKEASAVAKILF